MLLCKARHEVVEGFLVHGASALQTALISTVSNGQDDTVCIIQKTCVINLKFEKSNDCAW